MNKKALVLLSGGLDSILAVAMMKDLGIEVEAVNFIIKFCGCHGRGANPAATKAAKMLGVPLTSFDITDDYIKMYRNPKFGFGSNVNPCIDCKIIMLTKAKEYMEKAGASFLVTGEVLGERPMSQRRDILRLIEKQAGVKGILLRPLTAKLMEPTIPETEGIVDREKLGEIHGRGRKPQMALAAKFGITEFPNPGGGCLLTDPGYAKRVRDLIKHDSLTVDDLLLAAIGRNFRLTPEAKFVVGRNDAENTELELYIKDNDLVFRMVDIAGPVAVLRGNVTPETIKLAASIESYHTKARDRELVPVSYSRGKSGEATIVEVKPSTLELVEKLRI
jgi:tRNA-specific 2-thiouridylase